MPTVSLTAMPNRSEAANENETEQGEDCNEGGEHGATTAPHATDSGRESGETESTRSTTPQHTAEPTVSQSRD
jgi:hypothetical protein